MATFTPLGPGAVIPFAASPKFPTWTGPVLLGLRFFPLTPLPGILPSPGSFAMGLAPLLLPLAALLSWWLR